jgi:hypothetical protein
MEVGFFICRGYAVYYAKGIIAIIIIAIGVNSIIGVLVIC